MNYSRREFLGMASTLLTTSATVPAFLQRTAWATGLEPTSDRILVVLQLTGGNDGLNTVVPFTDDIYRRSRPTLQLADAKLHMLNDRVGLHPQLNGLKKLFDGGHAAVVQSVGYPNPNRSHFESMGIWQTAPDDQHLIQGKSAIAGGGWLARTLDARPIAGNLSAVPALRIGTGEIPFALLGCRVPVPSLADLSQLKHQKGLLDSRAALAQVDAWQAPGDSTANPLLQAAARSRLAVHATAQQIDRISSQLPDDADYPDDELAQRLRLIARLIRGGFRTPIYYTEEGGFDTHATQLNRHANVLRSVGGALRAFVEDVGKHVPSRPVLVMVFSEFGRRLAENASQGTDHGTAAPVFLAGSGLSPGVHGPYPDLTRLVDGDPVFAIDFRQIYATLLESWLGIPSEPILGRQFKTLDVLRKIRP